MFCFGLVWGFLLFVTLWKSFSFGFACWLGLVFWFVGAGRCLFLWGFLLLFGLGFSV